jgi:transcriptional antiterminator RfaH
MKNWYCVRTKRYKESWVAHQLAESGNETYLPLLRERRRVRRQFKLVIEPLFPYYLFSRFSVDESFHVVFYTPGVVSVVSTPEDGPVPVDERIISLLRERSRNGYVELKPSALSPGEELEIIAGPFQGVRALFQKELKAGERVAVLLELLSSRVRAELPQAYVQRKSTTNGRQSVA